MQQHRTAVSFPVRNRASNVLVVGGAGYVGSIAARLLLDQGYEVTVLDALLYGSEGLKTIAGRRGFRLVVGDTRDLPVLLDLLPRMTAVIHLGELVGDPACDLDPAVTRAVNEDATAGLAELAADHGVERFVYASSCSVYGATDLVAHEDGRLNPVSLYGRLKADAETAILRHASRRFHPTIFRLATAYGLSHRPRFDLVVNLLAARAATDGRLMIQGGGQWRPFVHVADVAELFVRSLSMSTELVSGQVFNVGSNAQNHTIRDVAEIVREQVPAVEIEIGEQLDHRNYRVAFDKVADALGFRPAHTVASGVAEIVAAIRSGEIADVSHPTYSNVRALVETAGRRRLWRAELGEGDPTRPFQPRDLEAAAGRQPLATVAQQSDR